MREYREVTLFDENMENLDVKIQRILEQRRQEELERELAAQEYDDAYDDVDAVGAVGAAPAMADPAPPPGSGAQTEAAPE
jgi:hypothetical protein